MSVVRAYSSTDYSELRALHLSLFPKARKSDIVDLDAMLVAEHPGFLVLEGSQGIIGCGICSPNFETNEVSLWGQAVLPGDDSERLYAILTKVLMAVLPVDEETYQITTEGVKESAEFFENLGFEVIAPVMTDFGVDRDMQIFGRSVTSHDIARFREELLALGIMSPTKLFMKNEERA